jgi:hypothetical protein
MAFRVSRGARVHAVAFAQVVSGSAAAEPTRTIMISSNIHRCFDIPDTPFQQWRSFATLKRLII